MPVWPRFFVMSFRLRLWLEHQGAPETHRLSLNFWQAALLAPHNASHHWEHHKYPTIPYHRLAELRKHDTEQPVWTLRELLQWFTHADDMSSGQVVAVTGIHDHQDTDSVSRGSLVIVA